MLNDKFYEYEYERIIIAAPFKDPDCFIYLKSGLKKSDFGYENHAIIFDAYLKMYENDKPFNPVFAVDMLEQMGVIEKVGGYEYFNDLLDEVISIAGLQYVIKKIQSAGMLRDFDRFTSMALSDVQIGVPVQDALYKFSNKFSDIEDRGASSESIEIKDAIKKAVKEIEDQSDGKIEPGVKTGFVDIDNHIGGLKAGELIIIAARPGMGKTVWANNLAVNSNVPTAYYTLEMSSSELVKRKISAMGGVDFKSVRTGEIDKSKSNEFWEKTLMASDALSDKQIFYIDNASCSIGDIISISNTMKRDNNIKLIIIDYLQLIKPGFKSDVREREVADISRNLKVLSRDLEIPIVCLAQLNRSCESRSDKRPIISDLRESGAIEQDADLVCFLFREHVYNNSVSPNDAEFLIEKGRNVQTGRVKLFFDGRHQTFENWINY